MSDPGLDSARPVDIADLRRRLGLPGEPISQTELARRCGCAASTICRAENDPSKQEGPLLVLLQRMDAETPESPPVAVAQEAQRTAVA